MRILLVTGNHLFLSHGAGKHPSSLIQVGSDAWYVWLANKQNKSFAFRNDLGTFEAFVTVSEIAKRFKISWRTCCSNVLPSLEACFLPGRKNALYRLSEVEQFSEVRIVEKKQQPLVVMRREA